MGSTATGPGITVSCNEDAAYIPGSAATTSVKTGLLLKPSTGTYTNGYDVCDAQYGDLNAGEGFIHQCDIMAIHPQTTTPYDKNSTAFAEGDHINVIRHKIGDTYWLPASSITASVGDKLITAASGLVAKQTEHTGTLKQHHYWVCVKAASSKNWVKATYKGILNMYTA